MNSIEFISKFKSKSNLVMSVKELKDTYFFGIDIKDQQGQSFPDSTFEFYLKSAQDQLEQYLNLKLLKTTIDEDFHFSGNDFRNWGYIKTTYPCVCPIKLEGFFNTTKQIDYPQSWLSVKKTSDGKLYHRNLYLVPSGDASTHSQAITISGIIPQLGYLGSRNIPNYWKVVYQTGFDKVPNDLVNIIGRLASINVFHIAGDLILGAGIASQSIGIDGLSQSISSTSSATNAGYGARITGYVNDLKRDLSQAKDYYRGFSWGVA